MILAPDDAQTIASLEALGHETSHEPEEVFRAEIGPYTCQCCKQTTYMRPEVALWRRYESALGRRMYWLALASGVRTRSRCDACEVARG